MTIDEKGFAAEDQRSCLATASGGILGALWEET